MSPILLLLLLSSSGAELRQNELLEQSKGVEPQACRPDVQALLRDLSVRVAENSLKIEKLQTENTEQTLKIEQLQKENDAQATRLTEAEKHLDSQQQELRSLKSRTDETENQVETLRKHREVSRVAFSASLLDSGSGNIGPYPDHMTLVFRHVIANVGNAYNKHTGVFTAPLRGVYHFDFFNVAHLERFQSVVRLEKNGEHVVTSQENMPNGMGTAGNSATLLLEPGDVVFLRLWSNHRIYDDSSHRYSTFSGRLLFTL